MPVQFNAEEMFEIAERIEQNGAAFYRAGAEVAGKPEAQKLLVRLADWEEQHRQTFHQMRADYGKGGLEPSPLSPEEEPAKYLQAIADGKVFDVRESPQETLPPGTSLEQIFREALRRERDTVVLYLGMRNIVPENRGREGVDRILQEEMSHVRYVSEALHRETGRPASAP